jgi:GNAT superfamily N-acetyltransferase
MHLTPDDAVHGLRFTPEYSAVHRLSDGTSVHLRLLRREDRAQLLAGFAQLSPGSRYFRFFSAIPRLPESTLRRLLDVDGWNRLAIVAEGTRSDGKVLEGYGLARFTRVQDAPDIAEAAVAVVDHMQRRGLGKLLLSTLAAAARERGIARFRAEVLLTNEAMNGLLRTFDETARPVRSDGSVGIYELTLPGPVAGEPPGPIFELLRLAASGLEVLLGRLPGGPAGRARRRRPSPPGRSQPNPA